MSNNDNQLNVSLNGGVLLKYDRSKPLPGLQRRYLDSMDTRMQAGFELEGKSIEQPNELQKSLFVAYSLYGALFDENDQLAVAMCSWIATRIPDLKQLKAIGDSFENIKIELVFDHSIEKTQQEQTVQFFTPDQPKLH